MLAGGRHFLEGRHNLFGYDGVVVSGGEIVSLVNLGGDEDVPTISLDAEVAILGDSRGYVSSGHKPGDQVKVIGWIKPSEIDKEVLKEQREKVIRKLFDTT